LLTTPLLSTLFGSKSIVLVIFAKMKKYVGLFFLCIGFLLALINASAVPCRELPSSAVFKNVNATSNTFSDYPHQSPEIISQYNSAAASQGNKGPQKTIAYFPFDIKSSKHFLILACNDNTASGYSRVKSYLFHIYPSHNFW
jgi:hypothetical protein